MRGIYFCLIVILLAAPVPAGNRADVNANQAVNAADTVLLANIVAGNLDVANYDLETVVVVAAQGGDFTSPVDAAEWVGAQVPSATNRFVILITPGKYITSEDVFMPSYTTLQGYGRKVSQIVRGPASGSGPRTVYCWEAVNVSIRDLTLRNESGDSFQNVVLEIHHCTQMELQGAALELAGEAGVNHFLFLTDSEVAGNDLQFHHDPGAFVNTGVHAYNSDLSMTHGEVVMLNNSNPADTAAFSIFGSGSFCLRDSSVSVTNQAEGRSANGILQDGSSMVQVFHSSLRSTSAAPGKNWYYNGGDMAKFFNCLLDGIAYTHGTLIRFGCCDSTGVAVP